MLKQAAKHFSMICTSAVLLISHSRHWGWGPSIWCEYWRTGEINEKQPSV